MKLILVGTDGSEAARRAVDFAAELAAATNSALTLVHVVPMWQTPPEATVMPEYGQAIQEAWRKGGEKLLRDEQERLRVQRSLTTDALLLEGHAAQLIAMVAEKKNADLVVVGSRGLGAISRMLLGSVSAKLVHLCTRPTLIVP